VIEAHTLARRAFLDRLREESLLGSLLVLTAAGTLDALEVVVQGLVGDAGDSRGGEGLDCLFPLTLTEENDSLPELITTAFPLRRERVLGC
jgi:hypothetical protein